jgi:hypothetical protein
MKAEVPVAIRSAAVSHQRSGSRLAATRGQARIQLHPGLLGRHGLHDRPRAPLSACAGRSAHTAAAGGDSMPPEPPLDEAYLARMLEGIARRGYIPASPRPSR